MHVWRISCTYMKWTPLFYINLIVIFSGFLDYDQQRFLSTLKVLFVLRYDIFDWDSRSLNGRNILVLTKINVVLFQKTQASVDHITTVSYTHLDVYKRQVVHCTIQWTQPESGTVYHTVDTTCTVVQRTIQWTQPVQWYSVPYRVRPP